MVSWLFSRTAAIAARFRVFISPPLPGWWFAAIGAATVAAVGMTTMVANATRVAAVAEDAARVLGLRSPGLRTGEVTATKRRQAQLSPGKMAVPVTNQILSNATDPGSGVGGGSPLVALLDQPGFITSALLGGSPSDEDVAVADMPPPPASTTGPPILFASGGPLPTSSSDPPPTNSGDPPPTSIGDPPPNSSGGSVPPAVPEPSTWMMMLSGFAAIGLALRRGARSWPARGA